MRDDLVVQRMSVKAKQFVQQFDSRTSPCGTWSFTRICAASGVAAA